MISRLLIFLCATMMLIPCVHAEKALFQGELTITNTVVHTVNQSYRIYGTFVDRSVSGFIGSDASTNDLVFTETVYGDVDAWKITNIITETATQLSVDVLYLPSSTNRVGMSAGVAVICTLSTNDNFYPQPPSITGARVSKHMLNAINNYSWRLIAEGTDNAPLDSFISVSNDVAIIKTNYYPLQSGLDGSNTLAIIETNYYPLQSGLYGSNALAIVLTNYTDLPSSINISNRTVTLEGQTNSCVLTNDTGRVIDLTGADIRIADSTETNNPVTKSELSALETTLNSHTNNESVNILHVTAAEKLLATNAIQGMTIVTGAVASVETNAGVLAVTVPSGGGAGTFTNILSTDGSITISDPGGPQPDLSVTNAVKDWSKYSATQEISVAISTYSRTNLIVSGIHGVVDYTGVYTPHPSIETTWVKEGSTYQIYLEGGFYRVMGDARNWWYHSSTPIGNYTPSTSSWIGTPTGTLTVAYGSNVTPNLEYSFGYDSSYESTWKSHVGLRHPLYDVQVIEGINNDSSIAFGKVWIMINTNSSGDFLADGTIPMTGDLNMGGEVITNGGSAHFTNGYFSGTLKLDGNDVSTNSGVTNIFGVTTNGLVPAPTTVNDGVLLADGTWMPTTNVESATTDMYLRTDGTVPMTGDLPMGGQSITDATNVVTYSATLTGGNLDGGGGSLTNVNNIVFTNESYASYEFVTQTTNEINITVSGLPWEPSAVLVKLHVNGVVYFMSDGWVDSSGTQRSVGTQAVNGKNYYTQNYAGYMIDSSSKSHLLQWTAWTSDGATFTQQAESGIVTNTIQVRMLFYR